MSPAELEALRSQVRTVVLWSNGMVMVFDAGGAQMPVLQGQIDKVREDLRKLPLQGITWQRGVWAKSLDDCSREEVLSAESPPFNAPHLGGGSR